jgi:protein phosphatase
MRAAGASDRGRMRKVDEDAFLVDVENRFFAVADGVGGNRAGEIASRTAVETAAEVVRRAANRNGTPDTHSLVTAMFAAANDAIREKAATRPEYSGMATTLVLLLDDGDSMWVAHCGDSRAYRWRPDGLAPLTRDHSIAAVLTEKSGIEISPTQSPFAHVLTKCLGKEAACDPEIQTVDARPGDRFLLCCDGVTDMVSEKDLAALLARTVDPEEVSRLVLEAANAAGGKDNITAVVIDLKD